MDMRSAIKLVEGSDLEISRRIQGVVKEICAALENTKPKTSIRGLKHIALYDLRGKISELPRLGIACVFPNARFGVAAQDAATGFDHIIICPGFVFKAINDMVIGSQTGIHHELAHIIYKHDLMGGYANTGQGYFNTSPEIDAFLQQILAKVNPTDFKDGQFFVAEALTQAPSSFMRNLTPDNRASLESRLIHIWKEANS